jgi:hypothetical protein
MYQSSGYRSGVQDCAQAASFQLFRPDAGEAIQGQGDGFFSIFHVGFSRPVEGI